MREIVSILLASPAPASAASLAPQERDELQRTFSQTVFQYHPPQEVAYLCMRCDLWEWCAEELRGQHSMSHAVSLYLSTWKAVRNADRLNRLCRDSSGVENFVVDETTRQSHDSNVAAAGCGGGGKNLSDWWYVGQKTEKAHQACRAELCTVMKHQCSGIQTLTDLLAERDNLSAVVRATLEVVVTSAASQGPKRKKKPLEMYRELFEVPFLTQMESLFSQPAFFGWTSFAQAPHSEKRSVAMTLLTFAAGSLHETTVCPLLAQYLRCAFRDAREVTGSDAETARRIAAFDASLSVDLCCLSAFPAQQRSTTGQTLQRAFELQLLDVVKTQHVTVIVPRLEEFVKQCTAAIVDEVQETVALDFLRKALVAVVQRQSGDVIRALVDFIHASLVEHPRESLADRAAAIAAAQCWWTAVKPGIKLAQVQQAYRPKLLRRLVRGESCLEVEEQFARFLFPPTAALAERHDIDTLLRDFRDSSAVQEAFRIFAEGSGDPTHNTTASMGQVTILSRQVVADDLSHSATAGLVPYALFHSLQLASTVYNSLGFPRNRTLTWIPYHSPLIVVDTHAAKQYVMSMAHYCLLEAIVDGPATLQSAPAWSLLQELRHQAGGARTQNSKSRAVRVLVDDLKEAGLLLESESGQFALVVANAAAHIAGEASAEPLLHERGSISEPVCVMSISRRRIAAARRQDKEHARRSVECALVRLFKSGATLLLDGAAILAKLTFPSTLIVDPDDVHQAALRLVERQYLNLDVATNMLSYAP